MSYKFNISLSVLNHLGRNLYRSFITVIGEAISNSWDADANNVWIKVDRNARTMYVVDDGDGMSESDFQNKFLKIGYSKRNGETTKTNKGRPFIGRKGIGKLALLSCAKKIHIASKASGFNTVSGQIDNSGLDEAIKDDRSVNEYILEDCDPSVPSILSNLKKGTVIFFEDINDGVINSIDYLKKIIALNYRFSLIDSSFSIHLNGQKVDIDALDELANATQFVWQINNFQDRYLANMINPNKNPNVKNYEVIKHDLKIYGFIASTNKPSDMKIRGTDEKLSIDLFVNGRLREKDLLKHIPTTRVVESYLYGQIHYNDLDYSTDAFTSSREGIVKDDPVYQDFLRCLKSIISVILSDWDRLRRKQGLDGDADNPSISAKARKAESLFNETAKEMLPDNSDKTVETWVKKIREEATFNIPSYSECFLSENLLREYIRHNSIPLTPSSKSTAQDFKRKEEGSKNTANISYGIRQSNEDIQYLDMALLAYHLEERESDENKPSIKRDAKIYKPLRDAVAHTSLITEPAKAQLNIIFENTRARLKRLLQTNDKNH